MFKYFINNLDRNGLENNTIENQILLKLVCKLHYLVCKIHTVIIYCTFFNCTSNIWLQCICLPSFKFIQDYYHCLKSSNSLLDPPALKSRFHETNPLKTPCKKLRPTIFCPHPLDPYCQRVLVTGKTGHNFLPSRPNKTIFLGLFWNSAP